MERTFFLFGVLPSRSRAVWLGFNMDSAKRKNYFLGKKDFPFCLGSFLARRKGSGE